MCAPSRLHLGMLSLGGDGRQFGGAGVMIDQPGLRLRAVRDITLAASGPLAERAVRFARCWARFHQLKEPPACRFEIQTAPPEHVGLGVGTQLGLAVAAALNALYGRAAPAPTELALSVLRGRRSAIGVYGFLQGGLIVEPGKLPGEPLAPLSCRVGIPPSWRFVLLRPPAAAGLAGAQEVDAFAQLPPVAPAVTQKLTDELRQHLLPAAVEARFHEFSESLFRYGKLSGECFRAVQGGSYNGPRLSELVRQVQRLGLRGVAQSSWGPTLFAAAPDEAAAAEFVAALRRDPENADLEITVAAPNNTGAKISPNGRGEPDSPRNCP